MTYTNRDDEFDGTEYDNAIADLRDEICGLRQDLRSEREQCERHEERIENLLEDLHGAEHLALRLEDAHRLLESILEDVRYDLEAHGRGARTPEEAWGLLHDIADRIREVV